MTNLPEEIDDLKLSEQQDGHKNKDHPINEKSKAICHIRLPHRIVQ